MNDRFYAAKHEDGSWQVFDSHGGEPLWNFNHWSAKREADHLNGKHEGKAHTNCDRCKEEKARP